MVVDDEPVVRSLCRRMLESAGYQVYEASDGMDALASLALIGRIDAVVTDLQMPNMDGVALATHLARQSPPIPTLIISGFGHQQDRVRNLGPLLTKPFTPQQLLENVQQALNHSARRTLRAVD